MRICSAFSLWSIITVFFSPVVYSQSCCSGGVPLAAGLGLPYQAKGTLQTRVTYDLNVLRRLLAGRKLLGDRSRDRKTHALLIQADYTFAHKWSAEVLVPLIRQERAIRQRGASDFTATNGLGDVALLIRYHPLQLSSRSSTGVSIGLGMKAPTGASDLQRKDGLTLNADLQPGSGALDQLAWARITHTLAARKSTTVSLTSVYVSRGTNTAYLGNRSYRFGNEFQVQASVSDRLFLRKLLLDIAFSLRYRNARADRFDQGIQPSTGGDWLFLELDFNLILSPTSSLVFGSQLPIYDRVAGTQISPSYRFHAGYAFTLSPKVTPNISKIQSTL